MKVTKEQICRNCQKAMKAIYDYTCKETCETVKGEWCCKKYKAGTPVGGR